MKIVVNDIAATEGGALTVLRDFYDYVCEHDKENQWVFLLADKFFAETENVKIQALPKIKNSRLRKLWFDFVSGKYYIQKLQPDVVFSLQNIITFGLKVPQAVYIHQAIPFQTEKEFSFFKSEERKIAMIQHLIGWVIKRSAKKSACVIVQTQWMRRAVCQQCGIEETRVYAVRPQLYATDCRRNNSNFEPGSFFYPTADAIYKNNTCAVEASRILDERGITHSLTMTLPPEGFCSSVRYVGRLPYEDVISSYGRSALVFPSYIESLAYPLLEARQAGTIILASDTAFSHEVLQGYENAYYFDPFRPEQLAELMEAVVEGTIKYKPVQCALTKSAGGWEVTMRLIMRLGEDN